MTEVFSQIPSTYDVIEELGTSGANRTKHIREQGTGREFVINEIQCATEQQAQAAESVLIELEKLWNRYIIRYVGHKRNELNFTVFSEYMDGSNLLNIYNDLLTKQQGFSTSQTFEFIAQMASALEYLSKCGIHIKGFKPQKIVIKKDGKIFKLTGLEPKYDEDDNSNILDNSGQNLNYQYSNPEALQNQPETDKSNIFCLGLIAYKLVELKDAFTSNNEEELKQRIISGRPEPFTHIPDSPLQQLILWMLEKDPAKRISPEQILTLPEVVNSSKESNTFLLQTQKKIPPVPPPSQPQLEVTLQPEQKQNQFSGIFAMTRQKSHQQIEKEQQVKVKIQVASVLQSQTTEQEEEIKQKDQDEEVKPIELIKEEKSEPEPQVEQQPEPEPELPFLTLPPIKPVSIDQLKQIQQIIIALKEVKQSSRDAFNQISNALRSVRSIEINEQNNLTEEIKNINKEIIENIFAIIKKITNKVEDVDFAIFSGFIVEFIDLIRRTPIEQITKKLMSNVNKITDKSSIQQIQIIFEMGLIQILTPSLKNNDKDIQKHFLLILTNIINKGWKLVQGQQTLSLSKSDSSSDLSKSSELNQQSDPSSSSSSQSPQLTPSQFPEQSSLISLHKHSQSSLRLQAKSLSSPFNQLFQLFQTSLPHPYYAVIEQQQIVNTILENILLNEEVDIMIKKKAWELLDALYPEGIKFPSDRQADTIRQFSTQLKSDDDNIKQEALQSASFLAVNKENHSAIIAGGGIDIAVGNIKKESEGKDVD
ncbi:MAG: hypothetical protein EZS28_010654, partial [Streblomastix strix]